METMLMEDLGSNVTAWAALVNGSIVCIATPRIKDDAAARRQIRSLVRRLGGDCATCGRCLIGREITAA